MQKITPHLWYDTEAREAAEFYASIFGEHSKVKGVRTLHNTPSGSVDIVSLHLAGEEFTLLSAGPLFRFNPSVSFFIACRTKAEVDAFWGKLSPGGMPLMPLGEYPFSDWYGWTQDRYGLSWQVMHVSGREIRSKIIPTLMFVGPNAGKAEEAMNFYAKIFRDSPSGYVQGRSDVGDILRYGSGEGPDAEGTVKYARFVLAGQEFAAMDSAYPHEFAFNEAISFIVNCDTQEEIDYFWESLSAVPSAEQCGWLKDRYGLSWQIVPTIMDDMLGSSDAKKLARVTEAFLKMKKFDIAELIRAAEAT